MFIDFTDNDEVLSEFSALEVEIVCVFTITLSLNKERQLKF